MRCKIDKNVAQASFAMMHKKFRSLFGELIVNENKLKELKRVNRKGK